MRDKPSLSDETVGHPDYFIDMIEQLAEQARAIGEGEVAVHLDALAKARRQKLDRDGTASPVLNMSL